MALSLMATWTMPRQMPASLVCSLLGEPAKARPRRSASWWRGLLSSVEDDLQQSEFNRPEVNDVRA